MVLRRDLSEFGQQSAQPVDARCAFFDQALPHAVQAEERLLLDAFVSHETHVRLQHRRTHGLGIVGVVLPRQTLAKRPYELGRHDPRVVPQLVNSRAH